MVELPQLAKVAISEIHKKQVWAHSIDVFISVAEVLQLAFIQSLENKYPDPIFPADNTRASGSLGDRKRQAGHRSLHQFC